jgi:hypothetical protein
VEFTGFVSSRLSPVEREALSNAVEQVNDFLLSELVELYNETAGPAAMRMFSSDHEYLFDMAFDGIDDPDTYEGSQLGVASLHPSAWFEPFHADAPVHPLLA